MQGHLLQVISAKIKDLYKRLRSISIYKPTLRRVIIVGLSLLLLGMAIPLIFILTVSWGFFGDIPDDDQLRNIKNSTATEIYSADSVLLGKYYYQNRTNTKYKNISPYLIDALIATEDARFYEHEGIDFKSWGRVFVKTLLLGDRDAGGGSTISQQLAKNLFGRGDQWIGITKIKEAIIARKLEELYDKEEILTLYFNTVPFGDNVFGVETAATRYFNKTARTVSVQEAATLIGMLKANYDYNPRINPDKSRSRRNVVLEQMARYGYLAAPEADSVQQLPLETDLQIITTDTGLATYFREFLRQEMEQWVKDHPKEDGSFYDIYSDGLKIYTTIDSRMQRYAERAVRKQMKELQKAFDEHWKTRKPWNDNDKILADAVTKTSMYKNLKAEGMEYSEIKSAFAEKKNTKYFTYDGLKEKEMSTLDSIKHHLMILHAGLLALDPQEGLIKAWVGGIDHSIFKYDHVNRRTKRQVGSTIKPIVYTAALQAGQNPCDYIHSEQVEYDDNGESWKPRNSSNAYDLKYSMAGALMNSVNTVSVKLLEKAGVENVVKLAHKMGIENDIPEVLSVALGTNTASLYEMVRAYATFANDGKPVDPIYITTITDQEGEVLQRYHADTRNPQIIRQRNLEMINQMMRGVVNEGTASKLRWKYNITNDFAGKTGTTQHNADGWFIGFNPQIVVGTWVGADDPRVRFRSTNLGQGSSTALPIFANFFRQLNADDDFNKYTSAKFPQPSRMARMMMNCEPFIEEDPSLWEMLFGPKEKELKKPKRKKRQRQKRSIFKSIGDLFKPKKDDS